MIHYVEKAKKEALKTVERLVKKKNNCLKWHGIFLLGQDLIYHPILAAAHGC